MTNNFDPVTYLVGDKVIARNKEPDINGNIPHEEEIVAEETIEFSPGKFCQVLYFASNPKTFNLAFNYEPVDEEDKKRYYEIMSNFSYTKGRAKSQPKVKSKTQRELNIKNFLDKQ